MLKSLRVFAGVCFLYEQMRWFVNDPFFFFHFQSVPELEDTVRKIYHNNKSNQNHDPLRAAAILYMFVEPEFRGRNIGQQALRIIAYLHHVAGCNYTILIADDQQRDTTTTTRTGRLVRWYERSGYTIAPDLEDMMGTARGTLGVPMIAPVHESSELPEGVFLEWWWHSLKQP